jgi:uncharacterized protein (DUF58 family)
VTYRTGLPLLFHWGSLLVVSSLLVAAILQDNLPLLVLAAFVLALALVAWCWSRRALAGVACEIALDRSRAFPGETVEIRFTLKNQGWLPLAWLTVEADLPWRLAEGKVGESPFTRARLRWLTALGAGTRLAWHKRVACRVRGAYLIGPLRLRTGDAFGLYPREQVRPFFTELLVYPRVIPVERLALPLTELLGELTTPRLIFEDPSRGAGVRPYQPGDPFRRIHWKASARAGALATRQFEATTRLGILIVLDGASYAEGGAAAGEDFELAVTAAASLANAACLNGAPFGLLATGESGARLGRASGLDHLQSVLEALARVERGPGDLPTLLEGEGASAPPGTQLVILTRAVNPELSVRLESLRRSGRPVSVIQAGADAQEGLGVIPLRSEADLADAPAEIPV